MYRNSRRCKRERGGNDDDEDGDEDHDVDGDDDASLDGGCRVKSDGGGQAEKRVPYSSKETMAGRNSGNIVLSVAGRQSGNNFTLTTHARQYHFGASSDAKQQLLHNGR